MSKYIVYALVTAAVVAAIVLVVKIISGEETIDAFDRFVENFYANGGDAITEEVNEWYASLK